MDTTSSSRLVVDGVLVAASPAGLSLHCYTCGEDQLVLLESSRFDAAVQEFVRSHPERCSGVPLDLVPSARLSTG